MGEFDEKLNAILGDPQAMGQIMALAQSLGGGQSQPPVPAQPEATQMPEPEAGNFFGELDPRMMRVGMRVLDAYRSGDDRKTALLTALRPFLKEERYAALDRAVQIARLSRMIRVALEELGKGEDGDV